MIKVYDIDTKLYLPFEDYTKATTNADTLGDKRVITAIAEYVASATTTAAPTTTASSTTTAAGNNIQCTSANHRFVTGQTVTIEGTTNYDGTYEIVVIDVNTFVCLVCEYVADETSGEAYPVMDGDYYFIFLQKIEDIFDKVKHISALKGASIRDKSGKSLIDDFAFTNDRRDTFLMLAREAADIVATKLSGYSRDIENAYIFNDQIDYDDDEAIGTSETDYMVHFAVDLETDNINLSMFTLIDQKILNAIVYKILADWFIMQGDLQGGVNYERVASEMYIDIAHLIGKAEDKRGITFKNFF